MQLNGRKSDSQATCRQPDRSYETVDPTRCSTCHLPRKPHHSPSSHRRIRSISHSSSLSGGNGCKYIYFSRNRLQNYGGLRYPALAPELVAPESESADPRLPESGWMVQGCTQCHKTHRWLLLVSSVPKTPLALGPMPRMADRLIKTVRTGCPIPSRRPFCQRRPFARASTSLCVEANELAPFLSSQIAPFNLESRDACPQASV